MNKIRETLHKELIQEIKVKNKIVDTKTDFQHIQIFDTNIYGKILVLDGIIQITEKDESAYSEVIAHVPIFSVPNTQKVLIIGGGDGAVAEEVLKHKSIKLLDLVDIDKKVVELSKKHFNKIHNKVFDNPILNFNQNDAYDYLESCQKKYDVVIADRPDPVGVAKTLYKDKFYKNISNLLNSKGVAIFQSGVSFLQHKEIKTTLNSIKRNFRYHGIILTVVPSYIGGFMTLVWASKKNNIKVSKNEIAKKIQQNKIQTNYYNSEIHTSSFALPNFIKNLFDDI